MATKKQKFDAVVSVFETVIELTVSFFTQLKAKGVSLAEAVIRLARDEKAQAEIVAVLERIVRQAVKIIWTVTSDGRNASVLIGALEAKGRRVSDRAKDVMSKAGFKVTKGQTYNFVVIRGDEFATDAERTTANIFAEGVRRHYRKPPADAAALLREKFTQEELGGFPYVVVMHEPIAASCGYLLLLVLDRCGHGEWLGAWYANPGRQWFRESVFVFLAP